MKYWLLNRLCVCWCDKLFSEERTGGGGGQQMLQGGCAAPDSVQRAAAASEAAGDDAGGAAAAAEGVSWGDFSVESSYATSGKRTSSC
jgi:hypothetical protein